MKLNSHSTTVGALQPSNKAIQKALKTIEQTGAGLFYVEGFKGFDPEDLIHKPEAVEQIQRIRDQILVAANIQPEQVKTLEYHCDIFDAARKKEERTKRELGEPASIEVWHTDQGEEFLFCTFGDIARLQVLHTTFSLEGNTPREREFEIVAKSNQAEKDGSGAVIEIRDGVIRHLNQNTIHRRALSHSEGLRHTFRLTI